MTTPTTVNIRLQLRADTAANWTAANPILLVNEFALETDTKKLKVGDGSTAWNSLGYFPFVVSGGTVTGNLEIGSTGTLTFEGSTANDFETTLGVVDPTADRTINLPDVSGTIITTGDTGTVTSAMIADGAIVDADISGTAEISVSKLADGTARQLLQTDAAGTGVEWTSNVDVPGTLDVSSAATFDSNVTIAGDLTVNGTTTTINTETLTVKDKNIELAVVETPTDTTANGGGITLKGTTDKTINWLDATDSWTSSENIDLANGKSYRINDTEVLSATTLGSGVTSSSLTSVGTISAGTWQGTAIDAAYLDSTVVTTGDTGSVTSTMIADGTIVNADVSASAAIAGSKIDPDFGSQTIETTGDLAINTNTLFVDASANAVGIGTSSPGSLLSVKTTGGSDLFYVDDNTSKFYFSPNGSGEGIIKLDTANAIRFLNAGGERLRISSGGNVGIGTTSAGSPLHVKANSSEGIRIESPDFAGIYGLLTSRRSFGSPLDIAAVHSVGALEPEISFSRSTNGSTFSESARFDKAGRFLVGTSSARTSASHTGSLQLEGTSFSTSTFSIIADANDSTGSYIHLGKARGGSIGSTTIVQAGDTLGQIHFTGADGTNLINGAWISAVVDGTPGTNDLPTRLVFSVTADGAASPTEALRISSNRAITVSDGGHIVLGTGTGTKIGTSTSQKIGFFDETPIVQPTTGIAEAAFVENSGGTAVNVDSTFGGYTIQQVVQALQNLGLLA